MHSAKEQMSKIIHEQPDDNFYDDVVHDLAFDRIVERSIDLCDSKRTISNEEMKHRIRTWGK